MRSIRTVNAGRLLRSLGCLLGLLLAGGASPALAGGGPQNVLLVVNARSWASQTVANYYVRFRGIPDRNVVYVDWDDRLFTSVKIDVFREKILAPVLQAINRQGIDMQIDYIVYSSDFPTVISIQGDVGATKLPQQLSPTASITGLTYYYQYVAIKNIGYLQIGDGQAYSNLYYRRLGQDGQVAPTQAFRSWYGWNAQGDSVEAGGQRYMLSTLLGVTGGRGNSVSETVAYLKASREADGSRPQGTIYFMDNADPRTTARKTAQGAPGQPNFAQAIDALNSMGVKAELARGQVPVNKPDVQGLIMGSEKFDWAASGSVIRPGAICDNLTSFGGMFEDNANQTPLTEFLRYGAAGSAGTVIEPYLILQKFPSPFVQVHYARGASLAEAFYQSVAGPYQLLIVGDPLCQPWAKIPQVAVTGVTPAAEVKETITLRPTARVPGGGEILRFVLFIDGRSAGDCYPGGSISFDTRRVADGYHHLRVVAIEKSAIESQGAWLAPIVVNNHGASCQLAVAEGSTAVTAGQPLQLSVDAPGAEEIVVMHNTRQLGSVKGASGTLTVETKQLGLGPVRLVALALDEEPEVRERAISPPLEIDVRPGPSLPPAPRPAGSLKPGLLLTLANGTARAITDTIKSDWLQAAGVKSQEAYTLSGYVDVPYDDVYQFHVAHLGSATIRVDDQIVHEASTPATWPMHYAPVALQPGLHRVEIQGKAAQPPRMELRFGGPGAWRAGEQNFQHE